MDIPHALVASYTHTHTIEPYDPEAQVTYSDDLNVDAMDKIINAQLQIAHNGTMKLSIVKYRKRYFFGNPIGIFNSN